MTLAHILQMPISAYQTKGRSPSHEFASTRHTRHFDWNLERRICIKEGVQNLVRRSDANISTTATGGAYSISQQFDNDVQSKHRIDGAGHTTASIGDDTLMAIMKE